MTGSKGCLFQNWDIRWLKGGNLEGKKWSWLTANLHCKGLLFDLITLYKVTVLLLLRQILALLLRPPQIKQSYSIRFQSIICITILSGFEHELNEMNCFDF